MMRPVMSGCMGLRCGACDGQAVRLFGIGGNPSSLQVETAGKRIASAGDGDGPLSRLQEVRLQQSPGGAKIGL
jgi:hypothetical protein